MHSWRSALLALAAPAVVLLAVGCGPSGGGSTAHRAEAASASAAARSAAAQITSSPQFKASEARAQQCVKAGGSLLTVWHCIAPKGHSKARDKCVRTVLVDNLSSKAKRAQIPVLAAACAEKFA